MRSSAWSQRRGRLAAEREMAKALELNREAPIVRLRDSLALLMPQNRIVEAFAELESALNHVGFGTEL